MAQLDNPGCLVCRSRKVKCDRGTPSCRNCERLSIQCPGCDELPSFPSRNSLDASVENIFRASGVERRRVGSCEECRRTKSRCTKSRPTCRRCVQKDLECRYPAKYDSQVDVDVDVDVEEPSLSLAPISRDMGIEPTVGEEIASPRPMATATARSLDWLHVAVYPRDRGLLRTLVTVYFDRISTLRCLGFIHKPSFMQALDRGFLVEEYGESLIYIISALGARIHYRDTVERLGLEYGTGPGHEWAEKAQALAMRDMASPSLGTLMTMTLICEYAMTTDQHALAFMVMGCCYRTVRLLGLDSMKRPQSMTQTPLDSTQTESERRLLWSCYILDSFIGGGVDGNLEWKDDAPRVPLPGPDHNFVAQTRALEQQELPTLDRFGDFAALNLRSHIIYLVRLRTRVLRLIRTSNQSIDISDPQSPFINLILQLETWYSNIPEQLVLSNLNAYVLKELNILGAVFMLHFFYHTIACDLTRTSLAGFDFPLAAAFHSTPASFREQCQQRCRFHADEISRLVRDGLVHGRRVFDDCHCVMATFESTKIQIVHTATTTPNSAQDRQRATENIQINMKMLDAMHFNRQEPNQFHRALLPLLTRFGFHNVASEWQGTSNNLPMYDNSAEVTGPAEAAYLSKLAPFRLAKSDVQARARRLSSSVGREAALSCGPNRQPPMISPAQDRLVQANVNEAFMAPTEMTGAVPPPDGGNYYPDPAQSVAQNDATTMDPSEFSVDEYVRVARDMSDYITWDLSALPSWIDFDPESSNYSV